MSKIRFNEELVVAGQRFASKEEVILELASRLARQGCVESNFAEPVLRREADFPTGLPTSPVGVAIPHADPEHCKYPGLAVAVLTEPVKFGLMGTENDEVDVRIVFLLALPREKQVKFLSHLSALLTNPEAISALSQLTDPAAVAEFIYNSIDLSLQKGGEA